VAIIDIGEARRRRETQKTGASAEPSVCLSYRRLEVEKYVYERLKALGEVGGPDALCEMGERLILQIASRVTAECGRECALDILEAVAVGTAEIVPAVTSQQASATGIQQMDPAMIGLLSS